MLAETKEAREKCGQGMEEWPKRWVKENLMRFNEDKWRVLYLERRKALES